MLSHCLGQDLMLQLWAEPVVADTCHAGSYGIYNKQAKAVYLVLTSARQGQQADPANTP